MDGCNLLQVYPSVHLLSSTGGRLLNVINLVSRSTRRVIYSNVLGLYQSSRLTTKGE